MTNHKAKRDKRENEGSSDGSNDRPTVPEGVLRAIEDLENEETASKDEIESVLKF